MPPASGFPLAGCPPPRRGRAGSSLQFLHQLRTNGETVAPGQLFNLTGITEAGAHHDRVMAVMFVIIVDVGHGQHARIFLGGPFGSTVLGTANVMKAATLAEGTTPIESAACFMIPWMSIGSPSPR